MQHAGARAAVPRLSREQVSCATLLVAAFGRVSSCRPTALVADLLIASVLFFSFFLSHAIGLAC